MQLINNDQELLAYVPNVFHNVDGEQSLFNKITPWLDTAERSLIADYVGSLDYLDTQARPLAAKAVAHLALAHAVPSLDLVLTPSGFGVVSTNAVAPASKERVERLAQSLLDAADRALSQLVEWLHSSSDWRTSAVGQWYCTTLADSLADVASHRQPGEQLLATLRRVRQHALRFETAAAAYHLGPTLMQRLLTMRTTRADHSSDAALSSVLALMLQAEDAYITANANAAAPPALTQQKVWPYIKPVMLRVLANADLAAIVATDLGSDPTQLEFKNEVQGAYYF